MHKTESLSDADHTKLRPHLPLVVLACLLTTKVVWCQTVPLQATDAGVTDDGDLEYSLTNSASQPATAWSVTVMVTDPNGQVVRHSAITTDEYRAEADRGVVPDEHLDQLLLQPHRERRFIVSGPFDATLQLTVTPIAVVFSDGSSAGQPRVIESIFQRRAAEAVAKYEILRQLRDVQAHYTGIDALKEAAARLARSVARDDPGNSHQIVLQSLRDALTRAGRSDVDPARELAHQIDVVRREYQVAVQHSVPRKES